MDTNQLINYLKSDHYSKHHFCGVLSIDKLPIRKVKRPCSFIINTHESSLPGEHWFAILIPRKGKIEYFYSYGLKPFKKEVYDFIKANNLKFIYNTKQIQDYGSENCGKYCIFYIYMRSRGFSLKDILNFFVSNKNLNDLFINALFNKIKM